ncbi:DCL family protein, partial [Streptomyces sp. NPDC048425]|uniref:DCL family protein n=1 Tax=Streptomyces sp. NPDC048425 TaxID=3365548 RepID=UPI0037173A18
MPRGITIGTTHYTTKEAVRDVCRSIVQRYGIGGDVTEPDDDTFLRHLLERHPEYDLKRGAGIAHFRVIAHTDYGRRSVGLALVRLDGQLADFSWNACLTPLSHRTQVLA